MQLLEENNIVRVEYDENMRLFRHIWNDKTSKMDNEEYKKQVMMVNAWAYKVDAIFHLANTAEFDFTISPEMQEWVASQVFPTIAEKKVKKLAFLVTKDLFSQISIEQFVEENKYAEVEVMYFDSEEGALKWLYQE